MTRKHHVPWKTAGASSEDHSADEVVRETGWVFNNVRGSSLTLEQFVQTGDHELGAYVTALGLEDLTGQDRTVVEIGSGIGRMTSGLTWMFGRVYACDLDAAFLQRCRETVAQFGFPQRLQTAHVADGRTLPIPAGVADVTFSYITLQHCQPDDALALVREAIGVTRPGGTIVLNFRTWVGRDVVLYPLGKAIRATWHLPGIGPWLAQRRLTTRLGWQANRLSPREVLPVAEGLEDVRLFRSPRRRAFAHDGIVPGTGVAVTEGTYEGINTSHWWLVARKPDAPAD